eukprot:1941894-Alexandrium_andersonii.AAC.1
MLDGSVRQGFDYLCAVFDTVEIPGGISGMSSQTRCDLDFGPLYQRARTPTGRVGFGEGGLAHKLRILVHAAKVRAGSDAGFEAWRRGQVGACADQGVERLIANAPYVADQSSVARIARDTQESGSSLPPNDPASFMFPRMLHCTGPLHIVWNAYQSSCTRSHGWESFEEVLKAVCAFLGSPGTRS